MSRAFACRDGTPRLKARIRRPPQGGVGLVSVYQPTRGNAVMAQDDAVDVFIRHRHRPQANGHRRLLTAAIFTC